MPTSPFESNPNALAVRDEATSSDAVLMMSVTADRPEDRWMDVARRRMFPVEVENILVSALGGDMRDQQQLFQIMIDTWPRLQNNMRTLTDAAEAAPFDVFAACTSGEKPTPEQEKDKDLVKRALWGFKPQIERMELGTEETFGKLAQAYALGHTVLEIHWHRKADGFILPRATKPVAPGWWGYPAMITEGEDKADRLMLRPDGPRSFNMVDFPPDKFLISIQPAHLGHPSVSAMLRCLAKYWVASVFGLEWIMSHAQLFNVPFRWANYPKGDTQAKLAVASMLANIGTAGWGAFPEGTKLQFLESAKAAGELPAKLLGDLADVACDIVVLGQTLTSDTGDTGGGSFALGKVHAGVRRERLEGICKKVAAVLTQQLVPSILKLNKGGAMPEELPEIRCEFPDPVDAKAEAERDKTLKEMGMELPLDWLYERHGVPRPDGKEDVLGGVKAEGDAVDPAANDLTAEGMRGRGPEKKKGQKLDKNLLEPGEEKGGKKVAAALAVAAPGDVPALRDSFVSDLTDVLEAALTESMAMGWAALNLNDGEEGAAS